MADRIREVGKASIVVAAGLRYGAPKKGSPRLTAQLQAIVAALTVLPVTMPADAVRA